MYQELKKYNNSILTGFQFQKLFPNYIPCKVIGNNCNNQNYHIGYNVNEKAISICEINEKEGIYFCDETEIYNYLIKKGMQIAFIKLYDDQKIYIENSKCKTNEIFITKIIEANELMILETIGKDYHLFKYIQEPTEEIILLALQLNGILIKYVKHPTDEMKLLAIQNNAFSIKYIKNPTDEMKLEAIYQDCSSIHHIENLTDEMKIKTIQRDGMMIKYIKNLTNEMKMEAIKQNPFSIQYIENSTDEMKWLAIKSNINVSNYINEMSNKMKKYCDDYVENNKKLKKRKFS